MSREYHLQPFHAPVELQIDYAKELNPQQHAAVTALPGPALVIAGAGSGKTRTLTYRVAYLLEQGVPQQRILLLTFTNKAAKEMMRRVEELLGSDISDLWGGTFHSIGNRVLRRHAQLLGYQPDFTILDRDDAKELVDACLAEADIDVKATRFPKADVLGDIFSYALNTNKTIPEVLGENYDYFSHLAPQIIALRDSYRARKRAVNGMDFDDLLALWLQLLRDHPDVLEEYQRRFQFVLVDEYQDTNKLQSDLIDLLAARNKNVMVVGDDSQSIYSWRGANFANILEFPKRYAGAKVYKIETNYRSTPEILSLANAAIAANVRQFAKELQPARKPGTKPALIPCSDAREQATFVAQRALELREEGVSLNEMAVLYRSHFHALELQLELTRRNIPFSITSGIRFFEQAHIKDVTAYLKWIHNPRDEIAFKRLVKMLPGVGGKSADKLWLSVSAEVERQASAGRAVSLATGERAKLSPPSANLTPSDAAADVEESTAPSAGALPNIPPLPAGEGRGEGEVTVNGPGDVPTEATVPAVVCQLAIALQKCVKNVPKKAGTAWAQFSATVSQLEAPDVRNSAEKMIRLSVEAGYEDYLKETFPNYRARMEDIDQLASFALQFPSLGDFLSQLALLSNIEAEDDRVANDDTEQIKLSSIHQAKGLEFEVVFVIMLCDGLFPSSRSTESTDGEEEERRLFYVAITRARNELYLSYPLIRMTPGGTGDFMQVPSRFLKELPPDLIDEWDLKPFNPYG